MQKNYRVLKKSGQILIFHGYTDLKNALPYARGATAGIALLKPVADYLDSYTTKIFEYMAMQLPVITSDFPFIQGRCGKIRMWLLYFSI